MACSMNRKVFVYTTKRREKNRDASGTYVMSQTHNRREKSPLIIVLLFRVVVALLFTIGNENETTKNL